MRKLLTKLAIFSAPLLWATTACGKKEAPPAPVAADVAPVAAAAEDDHGHDHGKDEHGHDHGKDDHDHGKDDHDHGKDDHDHGKDDHGHDHASGKAHDHGSPHGGEVVELGPHHLEAVPTKAGLLFFLLDGAEKEQPLEGVSGKLTFVAAGKEPLEVALEPMGNHLHGSVVLDGAWKAAVTVTVKGEAYAARFEGTGLRTAGMAPEGHDHDHAHGGHDHGAAEMKLSEAVTSTVGVEGAAAGAPVAITLRYDKKEGGAVTDFEVTHERKLHVFVVSEDLSFYAHEHPEPAEGGAWRLPFTFPQPGKYRVYSDFKSASLGPTVTMSAVEIPGTAPAPVPLVVDTEATKTFDGLKVTLSSTPAAIGAGDVLFKYTLADASGAPVTDLEPYLGAMAHLFILHEDLTSMAHAHPRGPEVTAGSRGGPEVELHASLPRTGRYKLWAQFQRGGKIITTSWVVEAR